MEIMKKLKLEPDGWKKLSKAKQDEIAAKHWPWKSPKPPATTGGKSA